MNKKDLKYYIFIVLILILISVFELMKPKQIDWRFTLEQKDKIPYGTHVLFNTINDIFPEKKMVINKKTTWEFTKEEDESEKNYIYISNSFQPDKLETLTLLDLVEKGNNIFISSHNFTSKFSDTLNFKTGWSAFNDTVSEFNFYNAKLKRNRPYIYKKSANFISFNQTDTSNCEILAFDKDKKLIFFRQQYGKGYFYISSCPEVFTNYAMIKEKNYEFAYKMLSYLPVRNTIWDEYYKPFRKSKKTSLSFLLEDRSLKTGYYLLLLTGLLFVFFTAKRKQRIIPISKPYENKTLEFVNTISGLYYKSKNHKDIARKRFTYLNNFLQSKHNVNLSDTENVNLQKTAQKIGVETDLLKKLLSYRIKINNLEDISAEILIRFNKIIEDIYEKCK